MLRIQRGKDSAPCLLPVPQDSQGLLAAFHPGGISRRDMKWLSHPPEGFSGHYIFLSKPSQQHAVRRHIRYSRSQVRYFRHSDENNQVSHLLPDHSFRSPQIHLPALSWLCQCTGHLHWFQVLLPMPDPVPNPNKAPKVTRDFQGTGSGQRIFQDSYWKFGEESREPPTHF